MSTARRDKLHSYAKLYAEEWATSDYYHQDITQEIVDSKQEKYFCLFPYPYMNTLHLGHAFTFLKTEFAARYQNLKGKRVLFPFSFHCTGMPISAAAKKLKKEIELWYSTSISSR